MTAAAPDDRPETRLARLTRWVPTPRRAWRLAKRRPGAAAFVAAVLLALGGLTWPHARAAWVGHRLRYAGHGVTFGHYLPETARRWAPLPTDSALWKTPVAAHYGGGLQTSVTDFAAFIDDLDALPHVRSVGVTFAHEVTPGQARRIAARHGEPLLIIEDTSFEPGGLAPLVRQPQLTSVQVFGCYLPAGELRAVAEAKGLDFLRIEGCSGVRGELAALAGHPTLKYILADGSDLTDESLAGLARCPALLGLLLNGTRVTDAGLAALGAGEAKVGRLGLAGTRVTDAGLIALGTRSRLGDVDLADTAVTDAGVLTLLANAPNVTILDLTGTAATAAVLEPLRDRSMGFAILPAAAVPDGEVPAGWRVDGRTLDGVTLVLDD